MRKLQTGDIFFIHDSRWYNLISTGIMAYDAVDHPAGGGLIPYHCGFVYGAYSDRLWEATPGKGVRLVGPEIYDKKYITIWYKRLKKEYWPEDERGTRYKLSDWMLEQLGTPYDTSQILGIALYGLFKLTPFWKMIRRRKHILLDQKNEFICCEAVRQGLKYAMDINPRLDVSRSNLTPSLLNLSVMLENV